jgi:hypothetical protein
MEKRGPESCLIVLLAQIKNDGKIIKMGETD